MGHSAANPAECPRHPGFPAKIILAPMSKAYRTTPQEDPSGEGEVRAD
jgi:hypothetical protein